ncbi:uncharacterized protein NFIA_025840 [Aspergillus fischeri NRRL 181]|uniref:Uncharacterized protein n=1 Tax=Neosartorya fischeri (strain ATCC 1020 / DSM 3700 / CBS 544.65 / FGSC A1164 / JCM 1740 / NRRL 181 / WB 181) TaxID=331117 RepID=A1DCF1_NEOFI|nr:uncharacterized protein NFIA_025840 [Aspergillus fischeri NRRL 181]EAW19511.1 hypothetical protein NFIA_025840 [Aspergillus fischeri NRRL 181]
MVWKERLHVALYRSFLAGAARYRAYQEPLTLESTCGLPGFLDKFRKNMEEWDEEDDYHETLLRRLRSADGSEYHQRYTQPTPKETPERRRTVTVIFLDVFSLEEIIMPENVEDAVETSVLARPGVESPVFDKANLPGLEYAFRDLRSLLHEIKWFSGQPNCYWLDCGTPPDFQFVRYMLAKYFRLRFKDNKWDWGNSRNHDSRKIVWSKFTVSGDLFCEIYWQRDITRPVPSWSQSMLHVLSLCLFMVFFRPVF